MAGSGKARQLRQGPRLLAGVKTDPVEYRYSFEWLFRILAEEGIRHVQIGTFFELYHLPDDCLRALRAEAEGFGLQVSSLFTAHRELGGFFRGDPAWEVVARRGFEKLIELGALLGVRSVGANPGSVLRDRMGLKREGMACYLRNMKDLLHRAHQLGVPALAIEPMSCIAEPPTLPEEISSMMEELLSYHRSRPDDTATVGLCVDVGHGYADRDGILRHSHLELLETALPYLREIHLKNTDELYSSTFGFGGEDRKRGIVDLRAVRDLILSKADQLPTCEVVGYLEIPGPKLGRDYSDGELEAQLRTSLRHVKESFAHEGETPALEASRDAMRTVDVATGSPVIISPSLMCADMGHVAEEIRRLEESGCEWLHFDIMDAHFVPNMPLGLVLLQDARKQTNLPFDVHLMVEDNDFFVNLLAPLGVQHVSVHVESAAHLDRTLQLIRSIGAKAGVALNPSTPVSILDHVLEQTDFVLVMTVNPGYAGQTLVPYALRKIAETREHIDRRGLRIPIEVDGNVSFENIPEMVAAGADILVAGSSSVYRKGGSRFQNVARVRECIASGLALRQSRGGKGTP